MIGILSQDPDTLGPFHDGKVKPPSSGYSGYPPVSIKDVIAAAYLLRVALLSRIEMQNWSGAADGGRHE
ncbi:hypothetical protein HPT29_009870 [Microvirga terrae]|uniref:Uncharacterized protein n=1 Tax=Microvirga terrae TaxID=2740529 RepID=A0ABY5RVX0_9HYPH|nr:MULTISPECIES: hypothetical protein [Microvirga]MBQ0819627.1 hypothetical protein [Microvirga sp. HBU67558]UVF21395.1 hypothetical protein HPT29_009870 [Microvirga terrae]